jgi:hypothetical protein
MASSKSGFLNVRGRLAGVSRRGDPKIPIISLLLVTFASWHVFQSGNGTLYISNWSARLYVSLREFDFRQNLISLGSVWSPLEGFGQRSLENPLWMNLGMSHLLVTGGRFSEAIFGVTLGVSIFCSTYFLARRFALAQTSAALSAVISTFVIIFPSSFQWQRQTIQSGSLVLVPIFVSLAFGLTRDDFQRGFSRAVNLLFFGMFVFFGTFSLGLGSSLFLIPLGLICAFDVGHSLIDRRSDWRWQLGKPLVASLAVAPQVAPQFAFISLFRQSEQVTQASQTLASLPTSFWGDLAQPYWWYRWLVLSVLLVVMSIGFIEKKSRPYAVLGSACITFSLAVAVVNAISIRSYRSEVLPSSNYYIIALIPAVLVAVVGVIANASTRRFSILQSHGRLHRGRLGTLIACIPAVSLVVWSAVWVEKNQWVREVKINSIESYRSDAIRAIGGRFIPVDRLNSLGAVAPILDELSCTARSLANSSERTEFCGRVLLVDSETQVDPEVPRRDPMWVAALYEDFSVHGIPVVNSFGNRYSGPFWRFTSLAFSDGSEVIRAWTVYNRFNVHVAQLFGVKVVIADRVLPELKLTREFRIQDRSGDLTRLFQYRVPDSNTDGVAIDQVIEAKSLSEVIAGLQSSQESKTLAYRVSKDEENFLVATFTRPVHFKLEIDSNSIRISGTSAGRTIMLLPFEYSSCLYIDNSTSGAPGLLRLNGIQLAVLFERSVDAVIRMKDSGLGFRSCWTNDVLPTDVLE